jgi:hypothetical protein
MKFWVAKRLSAFLRQALLHKVRHVLETEVSKYSARICRLKLLCEGRIRHVRFNKSMFSDGLHLKPVCWHRKDDSHLFMVMHTPLASGGVTGVDEAMCA